MVKIQQTNLPQYRRQQRYPDWACSLFAYVIIVTIFIVVVSLSKGKNGTTVVDVSDNVYNSFVFEKPHILKSRLSIKDPRRQALAEDIISSLSCKSAVGGKINARALFCIAAYGFDMNDHLEGERTFQCDAVHSSRNQILDVWASVRAKVSLETITDVTTHSTEWPFEIQTNFSAHGKDNQGNNHTLYVWSPSYQPVKAWQTKLQPDSYHWHYTNSMTFTTNDEKAKANDNFVWIDVGSELGLVPLTMLWQRSNSLKSILSVEAAPPNWLLQQLNFACNPPPGNISNLSYHKIQSVLTGAWSPNPQHDSVGRVYWRKSDSATLPSWLYDHSNENSESSENHRESEQDTLSFIVPTTTFQNMMEIIKHIPLLQGDNTYDNKFPKVILHLNCNGCEYNLLSMSEQDLQNFNIKHMIGKLNWPSLPTSSKPPLSRATITRTLACQYRAIASINRECCAVSDFPIVDGEISTVGSETGSFCLTEFDSWAEENNFWSVDQENNGELLWAKATTL